MKKILGVLFFVAVVVGISPSAFAMDIGAFTTAQDLVKTLVGSGVTFSNVQYQGAAASAGTFTGGLAAGIGIDKGVVLTSGLASNLSGTSNTSDGTTGAFDLPGYGALDKLIAGSEYPEFTRDAAVLSFDFVSSGNTVYFNYVFGSDEYNEYVKTQYNDVFAFFFEGRNVALIPETDTTVAINTVNLEKNPEYYNSNDPADRGLIDPEKIPPDYFPYDFEYDGFTNVFTANLEGLEVGKTYHIDLAIADTTDLVLDSGVFLQAGTFSVTPTSAPEPASLLLLGAGLVGLGALRRKYTGN